MLKILNVSGGKIRFDEGVKGNRNRKRTVPACLEDGFKVLIRLENQPGSGL
jgi:hypothetical protein